MTDRNVRMLRVAEHKTTEWN
jgi:hypothetical protein